VHGGIPRSLEELHPYDPSDKARCSRRYQVEQAHVCSSDRSRGLQAERRPGFPDAPLRAWPQIRRRVAQRQFRSGRRRRRRRLDRRPRGKIFLTQDSRQPRFT